MPSKKTRGSNSGAATTKSPAGISKKRTRSAKSPRNDEVEDGASLRKRGRASTSVAPKDALESSHPTADAIKSAQRPARSQKASTPSHGEADQAILGDDPDEPPRKRGEPPFGGETTKIDDDAGAAAEQLESELLSSRKKSDRRKAAKVTSSAQQTPTKETKLSTVASSEDMITNNHKPQPNTAKRQYWLMKAEQEDRFETAKNGTINNTKFTIDDLKAKREPEPWDGVRNPVASKHMRNMRKGDLAFFYASGGKAGRKPGITGIMEVVGEAEPDPSVHDEGSYGFVEKARDRERWIMVKVEFRHKLDFPIGLKQLQQDQSGKLDNMQLFKQTRLSVSKVEEHEWDYIVKDLISIEDVVGFSFEDA